MVTVHEYLHDYMIRFTRKSEIDGDEMRQIVKDGLFNTIGALHTVEVYPWNLTVCSWWGPLL